jgi:hypothetical protein
VLSGLGLTVRACLDAVVEAVLVAKHVLHEVIAFPLGLLDEQLVFNLIRICRCRTAKSELWIILHAQIVEIRGHGQFARHHRVEVDLLCQAWLVCARHLEAELVVALVLVELGDVGVLRLHLLATTLKLSTSLVSGTRKLIIHEVEALLHLILMGLMLLRAGAPVEIEAHSTGVV